MITSIWQVGEPGAENEAELKKYCAKSRDMVEEAVRVFERVSLNHAWYNPSFGKQAGDLRNSSMPWLISCRTVQEKNVCSIHRREERSLRYVTGQKKGEFPLRKYI